MTSFKKIRGKTRRKMYCLVLKIEDNVQISEKREDSRDSCMK